MNVDPVRSPLPPSPVQPVRQEERRRERQAPQKDPERDRKPEGDTSIDEYA
jgi:hypothetical protein